jgi:tRNA(Met) C34 N-acetyltransferase TmcA
LRLLQDFEALTPNLLARTIETVEGGGIIVLLLKTMKSLRQLYTMTMVRPANDYYNHYFYNLLLRLNFKNETVLALTSPCRRCRTCTLVSAQSRDTT